MKRHLRRSIAALSAAILAVALSPVAARADFSVLVTGLESQTGSLYTYNYSVGNTGTVAVSEFDIAVNDPIGLTSIVAPSDFFISYTPGDSSISFIATDAGIAPGSFGFFSITSTSAPGLMADQALGLDPSSFIPGIFQGSVIAPSVVPEPSSLLMLSLGTAGVLGRLARARRRPTTA